MRTRFLLLCLMLVSGNVMADGLIGVVTADGSGNVIRKNAFWTMQDVQIYMTNTLSANPGANFSVFYSTDGTFGIFDGVVVYPNEPAFRARIRNDIAVLKSGASTPAQQLQALIDILLAKGIIQ